MLSSNPRDPGGRVNNFDYINNTFFISMKSLGGSVQKKYILTEIFAMVRGGGGGTAVIHMVNYLSVSYRK